jgi:hypothetical protein
MANPYWTRLAQSSSSVKGQVDDALELFGAHPVGSGYIDIIVTPSKSEQFLAALTRLGIATHRVTLWCEASETNKQLYGCPHGMGGPVHGGVWFSEMCEPDSFNAEDHGINIAQSELDPFALAHDCNSLSLAYVNTGIRDRPECSPCLVPAFWLAVPKDWHSGVRADVA